jgi:hypothetical protein
MADNLIKQRSNAGFSKLPWVEDGNSAMSECHADAAAVTDKTARLKQLRLARDAVALAATPPVKAKKVGKKKRPAVSLSDWLQNRAARAG